MSNEAVGSRDTQYYLDGSLVTFLVKGRLFRIPQYFLRQSPVFNQMFSLPPTAHPEGITDDNPIHLPLPEDVSLDGFVAFLKVIYPLEIPPVEPEGFQDWKAILQLASLWEFDSIQTLAFSKLDMYSGLGTHALDCIRLGREFDRESWIIQGYHNFIRRDLPPSNEEAAVLEWPVAAELFRIREMVLSGQAPRTGMQSLVDSMADTVHREINKRLLGGHSQRFTPPTPTSHELDSGPDVKLPCWALPPTRAGQIRGRGRALRWRDHALLSRGS